MSKKEEPPPTRVSEMREGDIVQTPAGVLKLSFRVNGFSLPLVRLCHPTTLEELSRPFEVLDDLPVQKVLRDQGRYAAARGGAEVDPLKG